MAEFPLEPELAKMLLVSPDFGCSNEILSLVALLSVPYIFVKPKDNLQEADEAKSRFMHMDGDHLTMLNVYHAFKQKNESQEWCRENYLNYRSLKSAGDIRKQLEQMMIKFGLKLCSPNFQSVEYTAAIKKCLISGYFTHVKNSLEIIFTYHLLLDGTSSKIRKLFDC